MSFKNFQFHPQILIGIIAAGFKNPTPIQKQAIPKVLQGGDLIGLAQTGTGKTAAYVLPMLNRIIRTKNRRIRALIIAPTRELVEQIKEDIDKLAHRTRLRSISIYGGVGLSRQTQQLKRGADIVVACPGRLIDHMQQGHMDFTSLEMLILDEADQMLDMGFIPDIRKIVEHLPEKRQTLMFSATMQKKIKRLTREMLRRPVTVQIGNTAPAETVSHTHFPVEQHLKTKLLLKILNETPIHSALVFTRTKHRAKRLSETLSRAGYHSTSLQGNLSQNRRQAALKGFRDGKYKILVATDIAARGIDVSKVSHVVNYDIPTTAEAYIHRIGRTGRAEQRGMAFNLVTREDNDILRSIDQLLGSHVERRILPEFDCTPLRQLITDKGIRNPKSRRRQRKSMCYF